MQYLGQYCVDWHALFDEKLRSRNHMHARPLRAWKTVQYCMRYAISRPILRGLARSFRRKTAFPEPHACKAFESVENGAILHEICNISANTAWIGTLFSTKNCVPGTTCMQGL